MTNVGSFTYAAPGLVVPPLTWTDFPTPTQTNTTPGYTVTGNTISSIYSPNTIQMILGVNINNEGFNSLVDCGATVVAYRFVNGGALRGRYPIQVFADPDNSYQGNNANRTDWFAYSQNINHFTLQIWHNGTSNFDGPLLASVNFVPEH